MTIRVQTDLDLTDDQKARLTRMVQGNGHFDHNNQFMAADTCRDLVAIHFLKTPRKEIAGGETRIDSVDDLLFETPPGIYLEAADGSLWGWLSTKEFITSSWHYGVLFQDQSGDTWFCGRNETTGGRVSADSPILKRITPDVSAYVRADNGLLCANLPAEGEFWLTDGDPSVVTSIPWWSPLSIDPGKGVGAEIIEEDRRLLAQMQARIAALCAQCEDLAP